MLARPEIAKRICSPTATAMAVGGADAPALWPDAITGCLDTNTKAYGKWPLAIYWASQQQRLGAVEAVFDWAEIETVLPWVRCTHRLQYPLCRGGSARCSVDAVGGHLVVLYGIEFEQNEGFALVMDPAGNSVDDVAKRYPLQAFSDAWISHRGGAYFFESGARHP